MRWHQKLAVISLVFGLFCLNGCRENPGKWPQDKVQSKIMESLELVEATLTPNPAGGFQGSGKRDDGETVSFTITQDPAASRMQWDAKGDRGFIEDGFYELK